MHARHLSVLSSFKAKVPPSASGSEPFLFPGAWGAGHSTYAASGSERSPPPTFSRIATVMRFRRFGMRFRRKPVYRRRRFKPVRRRYRRTRRPTPAITLKLTRTVQVTVPPATEYNYSFAVSLNDFAEHINMAPNFERVKVLRQDIRVFPQQNVSNTSTSRVGSYCLLPYHRPAPTSAINFPTALSIDKAKIFRSTAKGRMSFVPATRIVTDSTGGTNQASRTDWRPEFEITTAQSLNILYTGMMVVENLNVALGTSQYYTIVMDMWVRYKNQRSFN